VLSLLRAISLDAARKTWQQFGRFDDSDDSGRRAADDAAGKGG
jgi:hypothetical protein